VKLIKIGWTGHMERMTELRNAYKLVFGEPKRKRLHGDYNIKKN
jgi:hypothetical protein